MTARNPPAASRSRAKTCGTYSPVADNPSPAHVRCRSGPKERPLRGHSRTLAQARLLVHLQALGHSFRMSFEAIFRGWQAKRQRGRAAHAEERAFVSDYQRQPKNRLSQVLFTLAFAATLVGGSFAGTGSELGLFVGIPALIATVAVGRWIFKNWDY
jgi:hypothetical protein